MKDFDISKAILKLIFSNRNGIGIDNIIEYLDYINKVRYSIKVVEKVLAELENSIIIKKEKGLWFPVES